MELFKTDKIIRCSATPKPYPKAFNIDIPEEDVIAEGMIKKVLVINEDFAQNINVDDQVSYLLEKAIDKQRALYSEFLQRDINVNPLIVVQLPNKSDLLLDNVERFFEKHGITYENEQLAIWMSDKKQNLEDIEEPNAKGAIILNCTLMHKNTSVVDMQIAEDIGVIIEIGEVHNPAHLPVGTVVMFGSDKAKISRKTLNDWWAGRSIPASRDGLADILFSVGNSLTSILPIKCFGLSLSDQYWICPENSGLKWSDINFFENDFSKDIGEMLFGKVPEDLESLNLRSPDNTSDGWLKKKWVIINGKRMLMKGGSGFFQQEPLNEIVACAIMRRLGIDHIPYTLTFEGYIPYSLCETFITPETELIPTWRIIETRKRDNQDNALTHLLRCAEDLCIPNIESALEKMLVLDYIIANTDRHYNNFGFVRNAETLKWYGLAPIYDSGTSLWHDTHVSNATPCKSKPFRATHDEQIKLVRDFSWFDSSVLTGIGAECKKIFSQSTHLDEPRQIALARAIENRIKTIEQM